MDRDLSFLKKAVLVGLVGMLAGCGEPRAVMLPLQYPDGSSVKTTKGEPVMAGYQTYGSSTHANATALYESARPPTCGDMRQGWRCCVRAKRLASGYRRFGNLGDGGGRGDDGHRRDGLW